MRGSDAILVALAREARIVEAAARSNDYPGAIGVSGMGPARARSAAWRQVEAGAQGLISVGFAGALCAPLAAGDVLLPREILAPSGRRFAIDEDLHRRMLGALSEVARGRAATRGTAAAFVIREGTLAGVERVIASRADKRRLALTCEAQAVDMESAAIAQVAHAARLPFAVLRVVCDGPRQPVPRCVEGAVDAFGRVIPARLALALALRAWEIPSLVRLALTAAHAARVLRQALRTVMAAHD